MYTLVRVRTMQERRYRRTGHIYDISQSGMRFELDAPLDPGTVVQVRALLPGAPTTTFTAVGRIVRLHDDDAPADLGPVRMGMTFDRFKTDRDSICLSDYLQAA